jgi:hypothetical protein
MNWERFGLDANADVVWKAGEVDDGSEDNRLELAKEEEPDINLEAEHNKN